MSQVFISFIHEEYEYAEAVQAFIGAILGSDAKPFLSSDRFQVSAGEKWIDRIMDELKDAKVVLLMLSEESVKRPWVNFEAGAAWTRNIMTIPICFRRLKKDDLPKPYSSLQAVDLSAVGEDEYLAHSVAHHLGLAEPMIRPMFIPLSAMYGGTDSEQKAMAEEAAYENLRARLKTLDKLYGSCS